MVDVTTDRAGLVDLSFMASLECDLNCAHCMYNSSSRTKQRLDYEKVKAWCAGIDWSQVHACGFYGGEPSILLDWYARFVELVPDGVPKFVITGGAWSKDATRTAEFVAFTQRYAMRVTVSGTRWHTPFQNRLVLESLASAYGFVLKGGEEGRLISMGRAKLWLGNTCTYACLRWNKPWRLALHPENGIIFQSCDGEYPKLQALDEPFSAVLPNIRALLGNRMNNYRSAGQELP